jgi:hypothetical protein
VFPNQRQAFEGNLSLKRANQFSTEQTPRQGKVSFPVEIEIGDRAAERADSGFSRSFHGMQGDCRGVIKTSG